MAGLIFDCIAGRYDKKPNKRPYGRPNKALFDITLKYSELYWTVKISIYSDIIIALYTQVAYRPRLYIYI